MSRAKIKKVASAAAFAITTNGQAARLKKWREAQRQFRIIQIEPLIKITATGPGGTVEFKTTESAANGLKTGDTIQIDGL